MRYFVVLFFSCLLSFPQRRFGFLYLSAARLRWEGTANDLHIDEEATTSMEEKEEQKKDNAVCNRSIV
jgi:hypothetical protein